MELIQALRLTKDILMSNWIRSFMLGVIIEIAVVILLVVRGTPIIALRYE